MLIKADQGILLTAVQMVQRFTATTTSVSATQGIYLQARDSLLFLRATDLDLSLEMEIEARVDTPGEILLPGRHLLEMIRRLGSGQVSVESQDDGAKALLQAGRAEFSLRALPLEDFPAPEQLEAQGQLEIEAQKMRYVIVSTVFAASQDNLRPVLTGVLFQVEQRELEMVATDSHRLAIARVDLEQELDDPVSLIVPRRTLEELLRLLTDDEETVTLRWGANNVLFESPRFKLYSRLIEGQYLNYRQFLPQDFQTRLQLATPDFLASMERAVLMTRDKARTVRLEVKPDRLHISANTPDLGHEEEELDTAVEGESTVISFNAQYLIDVLRVIRTEQTVFEITGSSSPGVLRPDGDAGYIHLVMPVTTRAEG